MTFKSICAVPGVKAWGMKEGKFGLALIQAGGTSAGVFTENLVKAAPIELMRKQIKAGKLEAVIVNSGCANAYTGKQGYADAVAMTELAGDALGVKPAHVGVASTGVIGRYLDLPAHQTPVHNRCTKACPDPRGRDRHRTGHHDHRSRPETRAREEGRVLCRRYHARAAA